MGAHKIGEQLQKKLQFQDRLIELVEDMLGTDDTLVPREYLHAKRNTLIQRREQLQIEAWVEEESSQRYLL